MVRLRTAWGVARRAYRGRLAGENAQGLAEYALLIALIALLCVGALTVLGVEIAGSPGFTTLVDAL